MSLPTNPRLAAVARAVLAEPHARASSMATSLLLEPEALPRRAWENYLLERGWLSARAFSTADQQTQLAGLAVLSAALTFPLAVARSWATIAPRRDPDSVCRLCVVGARAEAALPVHIWAELSALTGVSKLAIEFSGPSADAEGVPAQRKWTGPDGHEVHLSKGPADLFHRGELGQALLERSRSEASASADSEAGHGSGVDSHIEASLPDAFVLFNPGLGEPGWERAWAPTMRALLASRRPLLMTALSRSDAARDVAFLDDRVPQWGGNAAAIVGLRQPYVDSPFASLLSAAGDGLVGVDSAPHAGMAATATAQAGGQGGAANSAYRVLGCL